MTFPTALRGVTHPPLTRILWNDLLFVVVSSLLLGSWLLAGLLLRWGYIPLYIGRLVFAPDEVVILLVIIAGFTAVAVPIVIWRWSHFHAILGRGVSVQGQLVRRKITPFELHLEAAFHFQGRPLRVHNRVRRNRRLERSPSLEPGRSVTVLVHQFLPENALICDLYTTH